MQFKNWQLTKLTISNDGNPLSEIFIHCTVCEKGIVLKERRRREKSLNNISDIYFCTCLSKEQTIRDIKNSTFIKEFSTL